MDVQLGLTNFYQPNICPDEFGCISGMCFDVIMKRHDTNPAFKVSVEDADGPLDLTDENLVLEANIWAKAKFKNAIAVDDTYFQLANNIGFQQIITGDIIVVDRVRRPEHMLVTGFDETNCLIQVQRAYSGTEVQKYKKGTSIRIFRSMNVAASIESVLGDILDEDGTTLSDQLLKTYLVYNWDVKDTCTPGCYWLEFKLLKMTEEEELSMLSSETISDISFTPSTLSASDFGCCVGSGVSWAQRFPLSEGYLVKVTDTATREL